MHSGILSCGRVTRASLISVGVQQAFRWYKQFELNSEIDSSPALYLGWNLTIVTSAVYWRSFWIYTEVLAWLSSTWLLKQQQRSVRKTNATSIWLEYHFVLVFGVEPDLTREGGSIPVTLTFQEATGKNVMLLPVGAADDGAHSQNEKLNR